MDEPSSHTGTYQSVHTAPPSTHSISYPQIPQTPLQAPLSLGTPHASAQSYYHPLPFPHSTPGHPYSHMQHYMHIPPHPPPPSPSTHHTSVGHHQSVFPLRPSTSVNVPPSTSSHHVDSVAQGTTRGPASRRGRKRKTPGGESENAQGPRASARRRVEDSATNSPPVTVSSANPSSSPPVSAPICGIGPSSGTSPPSSSTDNAGNSTERIKRDATTADATDVWYFMRALHTDVRPAEEPTGEPILTQNPGTPFIGCKLCPLNGWKVWNHGPKSSMTTCYRRHLKDKHPHTYKVTCKSLGLKYSLDEESESSKRDYTRVPFTMEMFYHLLMKWIVVDDQSFNVTDCDEFRDLLLYLGQGNIHKEDLPHRKMMTQKVLAEFKAEHEKLRQQMKDSLGRISFTTDLWSDPNLDSYMAVTAHFIIRNENGRLESRSALIAFRHIEGSHSGENLAAEFFRVLDEYEILGKIGLITMDNASNNGTLMEHLESALRERDIPFHRDGNRVRCFPHVINIACQAVIAALKDPTPSNLDWITSTPYQEALEKDLVGKVRAVVSSCRVSGQRRQMVQSIIQEGNEKGFWKDLPEEFNGRMPQWQLLRDCDTRWSSTYNMIDRFLFLWPAVHTFLIRSDLQSHVLSDFDIGVLKDIQKVLQVPHLAQELLSAERTPNLTLALPTYELLIKKWKLVAEKRPNLRSFVEIGINKLEEYVRLCRRSRIYAHAMVVDPLSKFSWITETWRPNEVKEAREWIKESMLIYQQHLRRTQATTTLSRLNPVSRTQSAPQVASSSLRRGYNRLASFDIESDLEDDTVTQPSQSNNARSTSTPPTSIQSNPEPLRQSDEEEAALQLAEDKLVVERELRAYEEATAPPYPDGQAPDPLWFWEVNRPSYPLLFQVAMDVLPAQASAVSCERVFSSSKETCTLRRSCLSPSVLEALQVLKYSFKQERLTFTSDLLAKVEDYNIDGEVTPYAINELMKQGKYDELNELISSSVSGNATTSTVA